VKYEPPQLPPKPSEYMATAYTPAISYNIPNVEPGLYFLLYYENI